MYVYYPRSLRLFRHRDNALSLFPFFHLCDINTGIDIHIHALLLLGCMLNCIYNESTLAESSTLRIFFSNASRCRFDSSVFVFMALQCCEQELTRDLEVHPPMIIRHILSRFVDGDCMEIWGYVIWFPWLVLMLSVEDISTINSFTRTCRLSWKYTMLHKDCFARNQGLYNSCKHTSSPCKSIAT